MSVVGNLPLGSTPVAIIDFETTGLSPKQGARVVEVSVVRVDPDGTSRLVLDTLVDPQVPVRCSSIHGIFDEDVLGAPRFVDIAQELLAATAGAVVMAYNASFDMAFLEDELRYSLPTGTFLPEVPYACLMYLRPAVGKGDRCGLHWACTQERLPEPDHRAAHDALAAASLWLRFMDHARGRGATTFGDLVPKKKRYKFMESWVNGPIDVEALKRLSIKGDSIAHKPRLAPVTYPAPGLVSARTASSPPDSPERARLRERAPIVSAYRQAVTDALSDAKVDPAEIEHLLAFKASLGINPGEVRAVHAALYAGFLDRCVEDQFVSHSESADIATLNEVLRVLGWAPGDLSAPSA